MNKNSKNLSMMSVVLQLKRLLNSKYICFDLNKVIVHFLVFVQSKLRSFKKEIFLSSIQKSCKVA